MPKRRRGGNVGNSAKRRRTTSRSAPKAIVQKKPRSAKKRKSPSSGMKLSKTMKELVRKEIKKDDGCNWSPQLIKVDYWKGAWNPYYQDPWTYGAGFFSAMPPVYHEKNANIPPGYQLGRFLRKQNRIRGVSLTYKLNLLFPFGSRPTGPGNVGVAEGNELSSYLDTLHVRLFLVSDKTAETANEQKEAYETGAGVTPAGKDLLFRTGRWAESMSVLERQYWYQRENSDMQINRERFTVHDEKSFTIKRGGGTHTGTQPLPNIPNNVVYSKGDVEKRVTLKWKIKGKVFKYLDNDQTQPVGNDPFVLCLITNNRGNIPYDVNAAQPGFNTPVVMVSGRKVFKFENFD